MCLLTDSGFTTAAAAAAAPSSTHSEEQGVSGTAMTYLDALVENNSNIHCLRDIPNNILFCLWCPSTQPKNSNKLQGPSVQSKN